MAALCELAGIAAATGVACGLGCELEEDLAGSGFTISMLPLKYAPSSITMRAVLMFPTSLASFRMLAWRRVPSGSGVLTGILDKRVASIFAGSTRFDGGAAGGASS